MEYNIDVSEMERQRYHEIKSKGEYIEVNILIGTERDNFKGHNGKMPVVTTTLHGCGKEEISCMYLTLKALAKQFEEDYPIECMMGEMLMNTESMGTIKIERDPKKED